MTKVEVKKLISETILNCAFIDRSPNEIAAAILTALAAKGYVFVPREPTGAMLVNGAAALWNFYSENGPYPRTKAVYRAMLEANSK